MCAENKIVTFIVPAYNSESFLVKCLSSFIPMYGVDKRMEVIVVNDGSKDNTKDIAEGFTRSHPDIFKLINKKNGGHGSAINAALPAASGKYVKVVDSDDWIVTDNLERYISSLNATSADVVITHFHTINVRSGKTIAIKPSGVRYYRSYSLDELMRAGKGALSCCMFHGITYKTDFYRTCGVTLSEGISYEDQEYCTLPFIKVETILFLDLFLYEYLIGSVNQSMSDNNQVARAPQLERVYRKISDAYIKHGDMPPASKRYFLYKMAETLQNYYVTMLIRNKDRKIGRAEARRVKIESAKAVPEIMKLAALRYKLLLLMHFLRISPRHLEWLKNSPLYLWLRRAIR